MLQLTSISAATISVSHITITIIIIIIIIIVIIIIIIITRPWPAFGRQGLVGSSGGYTYHGYTYHASLGACDARLGQIVHELVELCKNSNALTFQPFLKVSGNRGNDKTLEPSNLPFNLPTFQPSNLSTFQPSNLSTFQLSNLPAFQPPNLPTFLTF